MGFEFFDALRRKCQVVAIGPDTDASLQSRATDPTVGDIHGLEEILECQPPGTDRVRAGSVVGALSRRPAGDE